MNKLMGTKWFTFYTKVRPILSGLFLLAVLESFRLNLAIYTKIWWLTLSFAGAVAQFVLCILIAVKSGGDYPHFVRFTRKVLLFETIYTAYQQGVETYVRNFDMILRQSGCICREQVQRPAVGISGHVIRWPLGMASH